MKLTLVEKIQETSNATTFVFKYDGDFTWTAGQLLHYTLPHENPDDRGIERYFTISAAPSTKHISITTKFAGEKSSSFKKALFALPIRSEIEADGLEGKFTLPDPKQESVFIAGGIGITPYHSILAEADTQGSDIHVTLLYANNDADFVFKRELEEISSKHEHFNIHYFVAPERINEEAIRKHVPDLTKPVFYISGPEPMVEAFEKMLAEMGIADAHIKRDFFPGYEQI